MKISGGESDGEIFNVANTASPQQVKIVLLSEFFPQTEQAEITGGVEARYYYLAIELVKKHEVTVITSYQGGPRKQTMHGFTIHRVGPQFDYTHTGGKLARLRFMFAAWRLLRKIPYDIVDGGSFFCYPSALLSKRSILTYHEVWIGEWSRHTGRFGFIGELAERVVLLLARIKKTKVVAVSSFTKDKLVKHGVRNVTVVPNGIHCIDSQEKDNSICYTGRLVKGKRVDHLIKACAALDVPLKIIGDGPERQELEQLAAELKCNAVFTGFLPSHKDVLAELAKSKIFVSASVVEGFGISVLEALGAQVPYVVSAIAPFQEVTQGKGGFLIDPYDVQGFTHAIKQLLTDEQLYKDKQREGYKHAQEFTWEKIAARVEDAY